MPPPLAQGRLSFGLAFSSPDLFVALLGFAAPPVELGVYLDYQSNDAAGDKPPPYRWRESEHCMFSSLHKSNILEFLGWRHQKVKTTGETGGLHSPYKGLLPA